MMENKRYQVSENLLPSFICLWSIHFSFVTVFLTMDQKHGWEALSLNIFVTCYEILQHS